MRFSRLGLLLLLVTGCGEAGAFEEGTPESSELRAPVDGIVFVHGINGSGSSWATMMERFKADGMPEDRLIARSYADPGWGSNTSNAEQLAGWVQELKDRGAERIAIVAHSMGGLSSRYYLQRLGGTESVTVFITLGTMHHGVFTACLSPVEVRLWSELCQAGRFITDINTAPATPGPTRWVSIFSSADAIVPASSSRLFGAWNIQLEDLGHDGKNGLQETELVYEKVKAAL